MSDRYLIYSYEHDAWWRPARMGYTRDIAEAGRYELKEAVWIVTDANRYQPPDEPNEAAVMERLARAIVATHDRWLCDLLDVGPPPGDENDERVDLSADEALAILAAALKALRATNAASESESSAMNNTKRAGDVDERASDEAP